MERFQWLVRYTCLCYELQLINIFLRFDSSTIWICKRKLRKCEKENVDGSEYVPMQWCCPVHLNATRCQIAFKRKLLFTHIIKLGCTRVTLPGICLQRSPVLMINSRGYGGRSIRSVRLTLALQEEPSPRLPTTKVFVGGGARAWRWLKPFGSWFSYKRKIKCSYFSYV